MPLVVDKEEEKKKILKAFESCLKTKPVFNISLRDIAKEAHMTHPKLLNYFDSKDDIVLKYCDYIKNFMSDHCSLWFKEHDPKDYKDKKDYMNAFMQYVVEGKEGEERPIATVQTYVLAKYNKDVETMVKEEFLSWRKLMKECLVSVFKEDATDDDSEYMMILIAGVFICHYNGVLSGNINSNLMSASKLFQK